VGYYHGKAYFSGMARAGLMRHFLGRRNSTATDVGRQPFFNLTSVIRRRSVENLSSAASSAGGGASASVLPGTPQHMAMVLGQRMAASRALSTSSSFDASSPVAVKLIAATGECLPSSSSAGVRPLRPERSIDDSMTNEEEDEEFEVDSDKLMITDDEEGEEGGEADDESGFLSQI